MKTAEHLLNICESIKLGTGADMGATIDGVKYKFAGQSKDGKKLYTSDLDVKLGLTPVAYLEGSKLVSKFHIQPHLLGKIQRGHGMTTAAEVMAKYGVSGS